MYECIQIDLVKPFLVVRETLSRIGIINREKHIIYPSAYCVPGNDYPDLLDDEYYIVHFKQLFSLTGKHSTMNDVDFLRLKTISYFLSKWGLVDIIHPEVDEIMADKLSVLSHSEKPEYQIVHKFKFTTRVKDLD